jgi:hypothetical protein
MAPTVASVQKGQYRKKNATNGDDAATGGFHS